MSSEYLDPDQEIQKYGNLLPHWEQGSVIQFVTFRLGDALPLEKVRHYCEQRRIWLATYQKPWSPELEAEYHRKFTWRLERWLDQGSGSCILKDSSNREKLVSALMRFQDERVRHHAWVIMPNHVHLLFTPMDSLANLVQAWKSKSAREIGKGPIWQRNYRDTLIRDQDHFINAVRYIRRNPSKARLREGEYEFWESERAQNIS